MIIYNRDYQILQMGLHFTKITIYVQNYLRLLIIHQITLGRKLCLVPQPIMSHSVSQNWLCKNINLWVSLPCHAHKIELHCPPPYFWLLHFFLPPLSWYTLNLYEGDTVSHLMLIISGILFSGPLPSISLCLYHCLLFTAMRSFFDWGWE